MSALVLSWDAMLNMTKAELELISDADMCLLFEKGMRNGDSYISKKYSKYSKLHSDSDYPLVPDKIEIKKEMSKCKIMIVDLYNIPIATVKKLDPNLF